MPSYAILGATGNVGRALTKVLLQSPDNQIHAYCRSKKKLHELLPETVDNHQVRVFEGNLPDTELVANCFENTHAAFLVVAPSGNQPQATTSQDAARHAVAALERLKSQNKRLPKVVMISSATTEPRLMSAVPRPLVMLLHTALSHAYADLEAAERFLRTKEGLTTMTFVKPGALSNDTQKGHVLNVDAAQSPISFLDLAAGMVEVADETSERYDMKAVAVNATSDNVAFPWDAPMNLLRGLIVHFLPFMYRFVG